MKPKILITETIHECIIPMLEEIGYEVHYEPKIDRVAILNKLANYTGIIADADDPDGAPYLRGTWLSNPYPIERPPETGGLLCFVT